MGRIVLSIIFLIALVILMVLNAGAVASINLFGWQAPEVSITVVGLVCFVAGIVYSFVFYALAYLKRGRRERLEKRKQKLKVREESVRNREQDVDEREEDSKRRLEAARNLDKSDDEGERGLLAGLFGRKRKSTAGADKPPKSD